MAIVKAINGRKSSTAALNNCINYVLRADKTEESITYVTGFWNDNINIDTDSVLEAYQAERKLWNKNDGRLYLHNLISFHEKEQISPIQVLHFTKEWSEKVFPENQSLIAVHRDKKHLHCHVVTNSVSYVDGKKLSVSKKDLERSKELCNDMCLQRGLSVPEKGRHFDGTLRENGEIISWDKNTYNLFKSTPEKSYLWECGISILRSLENAFDKDTFIDQMSILGWKTEWNDEKTQITFEKTKEIEYGA